MSNNNNLGYAIQDFFEDVSDALLGNERQADLKQFADKHGFRFKKKYHNERLDIEIKAFDLFKGKKRKRVRNFLTRPDERIDGRISMFDFNKDTDFGKKVTTCVLIRSSYLRLPKFIIRPKKTTEKLTELFVHRDVGLSGYPFFNRTYAIQTADVAPLEAFFTQKLVDLMVKTPHLWLEGNLDYLLLYDKNKPKSPDELLTFYDLGREIVDLMLYDNSDDFV